MAISAAAKQRKIKEIEKAFEAKPGELEHLYIDTNGDLRDRYIEEMFSILFRGEEINEDVFKNNFETYFNNLAVRLLPRSMAPGPEIFTDESIARAWVTYNFGLIHVGELNPHDPTLQNPNFAHCKYEGRLRSRVGGNVPHYCYAPTRLHATLLTVVNLFRELAAQHHAEILKKRK